MKNVLIALIAFFIVCCSCSEQPYRHYSSYSEAISAGESSRGWLPSWIPATASDIHIQGDLDRGHVWIRFLLSPPAAEQLKSQLEFIPYQKVAQLSWHSPRSASAWWFKDLIWQQPANDSALNADVFAGKPPRFRHEFFIAFDRLSNNVYAWWVGSER